MGFGRGPKNMGEGGRSYFSNIVVSSHLQSSFVQFQRKRLPPTPPFIGPLNMPPGYVRRRKPRALPMPVKPRVRRPAVSKLQEAWRATHADYLERKRLRNMYNETQESYDDRMIAARVKLRLEQRDLERRRIEADKLIAAVRAENRKALRRRY